MAKIKRKKAKQAGIPVARMPNLRRKIYTTKRKYKR